MWLRRIPAWLVTVGLTVIGVTVMVVIKLMTPLTVPPIARFECRDAIIAIPRNVRPTAAPCLPQQSMQYMRDINGDKYIICTCPGHTEPRGITLPLVSDIAKEPLQPDVELEPEPEPEGILL
jgi:hypothetical protein